MLIQRARQHTGEILTIFIQDSASTTGAGKTGLLHNTASLTAYYVRSDQTASVSISLVTMTLGTYTSGGFKEIDATNMPGWYQFCPPNGVFQGGTNAAIHLQGASGMAPCVIGIELTEDNNQSNDKTLGNLNIERLTLQPSDGNPAIHVHNAAEFGPFLSLFDGATGYTTLTYAQFSSLLTTGTRGATVLPTSGTIPTVGTGSNQIALSSGNVTVGTINASVITASALATDAVTEIQSGLSTLTQADIRTAIGLASANLDTQLGEIASNAATAATDAGNASTNTTTIIGYLDTEIAAIKTVTDKVDTTLVLDGAVYQFTANALELAPSGGGGGGSITVTPLQLTAQEIPTFTVNGATIWNISAPQNSTQGFIFVVLDGTGTAVNLSAKTLRFVLHSAKAPFAPYGELATSGSGITVGGASNNQVTVTLTQALTARPFEGAYKLWNITDNYLLGSGSITIKPAPNDF